jgi:hypothetical protein
LEVNAFRSERVQKRTFADCLLKPGYCEVAILINHNGGETMLPKNVLYYGKDEPLPERVELRAGPLQLFYEEGDLRTIKLGEHEILRRIYVAVRDRNWGTLQPVLSNVQMDIGDNSFHISYDVENKDGEIDFFWKGVIEGDANGTINFTMDGVARSTFQKNRIGFCILHPAACAGAAAVIEHVDGTTEEAKLPIYIVPDQPVEPFSEMQGMSHEVTPGLWAEVRYSGDIFEMEDQRNWTDASYKTFSTPLRLPYPVEVEEGTRITQSVTLTLKDERPAEERQAAARLTAAPLTFTLDTSAQAVPLPPIGLSAASHRQPLNEREVRRLKALNLDHLRVDLIPSAPDYPAVLRQAKADAEALGVPLDVALRLSEEANEELGQLKSVLDDIKPSVATWLVYPLQEQFWGGSATNEILPLAHKHLDSYEPATRFAAGSNADFIFAQRTPPDWSLVDLFTFSITPQVHAFDNASIVETLAAQAVSVKSARHLAGEVPVMVSQITLKMRFNAYATGPEPEIPAGELHPEVDVRQMSLFGAGWTAGSVKYMAESGVERVTYYETTGWRGVMEIETGAPAPEKFRSIPGSVFPLYHVLADVGDFAGGQVIQTVSSDALKVDGLALRKDGQTRVVLANMGPDPQRVSVQNLGQDVRVRHLNETNAEAAMTSPEEFRTEEGDPIRTTEGSLELDLLPYAIVRIDGA